MQTEVNTCPAAERFKCMVLEVTGEDNIKEVMESVNIELAQISEDEPESTISKTHIKVPWNMPAFRKTKPNLLATNI